MSFEYELAFIGAGNMAEAIARAAINAEVIAPQRIVATDPAEARRELFASLGIQIADDIGAAVGKSAQIVLAVKPQIFPKVAAEVAAALGDAQVLISIMAGLGSAKIEAALEKSARIVRVMPNTPMLAGEGMAGIALGTHAQSGDDALATRLFTSAGRAVAIEESQMDALTAVSGSGPAYLFYLAEHMMRAAEDIGLGEHAATLVKQTLRGAAKLLDESDDSAAELRRKVTSPGGTTQAALQTFDAKGTADAIVAAVRAAEARGRELGS